VPVELRRAKPPDADFLLELLEDDDVRPFMGPRSAKTGDEVREEIERSLAEPKSFGRFVIEVDGEPAGMLGFHVENEPSRIARLERLAIHPRFRGRRLADDAARLFQRHLVEELDYHRLELEIYAFNERACAHAERVGFVPEGRKRKAYLKDGEWVDTVLYALLADELAPDGRVRDGRELEDQGRRQEDETQGDLVEVAELPAARGEDEHHECGEH
jgi:RimJ/RimL family protein N-acetyltransferase